MTDRTMQTETQSTPFILPPGNVDRTIQSQSTGVKAHSAKITNSTEI